MTTRFRRLAVCGALLGLCNGCFYLGPIEPLTPDTNFAPVIQYASPTQLDGLTFTTTDDQDFFVLVDDADTPPSQLQVTWLVNGSVKLSGPEQATRTFPLQMNTVEIGNNTVTFLVVDHKANLVTEEWTFTVN